MINIKKGSEFQVGNMEDFYPMPDPFEIVECKRCGWRSVVPDEYFDWKELAESYKNAYHKMANEFLEAVKRMEKAFNVPLTGYLQGEKEMLIAELRNAIENYKEGTK